MKRNFTKILAALALLVFMTPSLVAWGQTRAEVVSYTLDGTITGGTNGYATESEIVQNGITWMVTGNTTMNPWRIGGKNLTNVDRPLYSTSNLGENNITKVVVTNGTTTITVNSMTLIVSTNSDFSNPTSTISGTWNTNNTTTFVRPDNTDWSNKYFKLVYNVTAGSSNQYAQFTKAEFYKEDANAVVPPTFNPASGTYTETQTVTISCENQDATIYYTVDGSTPDNTSAQYTEAIIVSETTTINAIAYFGETASSVASATYTILNIEHAGTIEDPYTVADARNAIDANTGLTGVYATGIVSQVDSYNSNYNSINYWISDDGTTTDQLEAYGGISGIEGWTFSSKDDIAVGATVVIYGNLTKYNTTYEFTSNNQLVSYSAPTYPIIEAEETLTLVYNATYGEIEYSITNPVEGQSLTATTDAEWISNITVGASAVTFTTTVNEGTEDRTAIVTLSYDGAESVTVTVTQGHYSAPGNWVLTNLEDLTAGDVFVIVGNNGSNYALSNNNSTSSSPTAVAVTVVDGTLSGEIAENLQWNINITNDGYIFYPAGSATTWLYCTNTNNGVRVGTNTNKVFTFVSGGTVNEVEQSNYLYNVATSRYVGIYNSQDWRCYESINNNIKNQSFAFYKKVSDNVTYTKAVTAYEGDGGYVLIASPVCSVTPSADNGFLTNEYDLYYFNQTGDSEGKEWINYEAGAFNLTSGKGYLYANSANTTLTFTGTPYSGNGVVALDYDENATLAGWNLIGNPFSTNAYITNGFYTMNDDGSEVTAATTGSAIGAMEGVFVVATEANQSVTFSTTAPAKGNELVLNLSRSHGASRGSAATIDRAIVRFDEGQQLPKFQLNPENTKLYIAQGDKDYAIVRSAAQGEMPVSFRASENGTYTIAVEAENVEMNYLHLIDNMTGADVDLLATPNYTFEARTNDYTSRFRLVFSANGIDEQTAETFAFFNGTSWTVSNTGDATLQVVDITGRIVSSETINGNATVSINQPAGIYMLRLVNGNDVKVQKVVVR